VLINLVGNALKFTERGSVTVRVAVEPETRQPYRIDVVDTGIGVSREKLGIVFEAFQQADSTTARRFGGTGLGLAISRSLAQQLGYHLTVESEIGHGSTFSLHLGPLRTGPRSQARADASPTASPARA
jgi:signal transduction histidine kinase